LISFNQDFELIVSANQPIGIPPESSAYQQFGSHSQRIPKEAQEPLRPSRSADSRLSGQENNALDNRQ
jgi:hypothetical protein